jgi:biotin-(acetyl-CoA carboxylase) ligase
MLERLLGKLERWLTAPESEVLDAVRERDALRDQPVRWARGSGRGAGIDGDGRLVVATDDGHIALDAGEVHLGA